jgi:hypothetical protein
MRQTTRWLVSKDGVTAFREINGHWYDLDGVCRFQIVGSDVIPVQGGTRVFYIIDGWAFDETGTARYYYGRS